MAFIRDIEDALLVKLNSELSVPVIIAHDNAPEPVGDYGVVHFIAANKKHRNTVNKYITATGMEERIKQDFLLRFNIKFYGDSCHDNAFLSQAILSASEIQSDLYNNSNLSCLDVTSVQNNPEFRPTGFIARSIYDATFLSGFEYKRTIDWFDTVSYEGEYIDSNGEILLTTSGTVSSSGT